MKEEHDKGWYCIPGVYRRLLWKLIFQQTGKEEMDEFLDAMTYQNEQREYFKNLNKNGIDTVYKVAQQTKPED